MDRSAQFNSRYDTDCTSDEESSSAISRQEWEPRRGDGPFLSLVTGCASVAVDYSLTYLNKQDTRMSYMTGMQWVEETLQTPGESYKIFRMEPHVFRGLCAILVSGYGLRATGEVSVEESVAMFLWICGHGLCNRNVQNRFKHSGETISRKFHDVLDSVNRFAVDIIRPRDPEFRDVPRNIQADRRFYPYFKGCIGAIDGTHVHAVVPKKVRGQYIGRKGYPTQNVMVACDFDLLFTFVVAGWPGSAHDARIFSAALHEYENLFPHPPSGKYYLVDAAYSNKTGYLAPFKGDDVRYHISEFERGHPRSPKEVFNYAHASLRNAVERCIGVWKNRFAILGKMPKYSLETQRGIVVATMAINNYVRMHAIKDKEFNRCDSDPDYVPQVPEDVNVHESATNAENSQASYEDDGDMGMLRSSIAQALFVRQ